jgi:hypothetical protein
VNAGEVGGPVPAGIGTASDPVLTPDLTAKLTLLG